MIGIDSNILIDLLRRKESFLKLNKYEAEDFCTSEIVVYEILYGIYAAHYDSDKKLKEFNAILDTFSYIFPIDSKASQKAAEIAGKLSRSGQTISHTDALIAGSLLANGCMNFITKNKKDFEKIKELKILNT